MSVAVTVSELLGSAREQLVSAGIATAQLDAELLVGDALNLDRVGLRTRAQVTVDPECAQRAQRSISRRVQHEPVAYIRGFAYFRRLRLQVDRRVLIPRPETELLVDLALAEVDRLHAITLQRVDVVDACTGSGAIAVALAAERTGVVRVSGCDVSGDALDVARANGAACDVDVQWLQGDLLDPVAGRRFDIVTCNPPYVPRSDSASLMPDVVNYEPHLALFVADESSVSELVARLLTQAQQLLRPGGMLAMEIGHGQSSAVQETMRSAGWREVAAHVDLAGIDRTVTGRYDHGV